MSLVETDLAVRAARAEMELEAARAELETCRSALRSWTNRDKEALLDTLHIIGIPARDLSDIYRVVQEWRLKGGRPDLLAVYRERGRLMAAVQRLADIHHRTITGSRMHRAETREWYECTCASCHIAQDALEGLLSSGGGN